MEQLANTLFLSFISESEISCWSFFPEKVQKLELNIGAKAAFPLLIKKVSASSVHLPKVHYAHDQELELIHCLIPSS